MTLSLQLLWNYWSDFHETWYVDRTSYGVMHIGRKFWSLHFCGSYAPLNLENIRKSTNNLSFLCQFFINEITASDAGPDIIRSHLFLNGTILIQSLVITSINNVKWTFFYFKQKKKDTGKEKVKVTYDIPTKPGEKKGKWHSLIHVVKKDYLLSYVWHFHSN